MKTRTILTGIFVVAAALSLNFLTAKQAQACMRCTDFTFTYPDGYEEERRMCWYAPAGGYHHCEEVLNYVTCRLYFACSVFGEDDRNDLEQPDGLYQLEERVEVADSAEMETSSCSKINRLKRATSPAINYTL